MIGSNSYFVCTWCKWTKPYCHCKYGKFIQVPEGLDNYELLRFIDKNPNGLGEVIEK